MTMTPAISAHAADPYQWKNAQIVGGGFIPGIVFNASQKDLIYARTDIGGPYRWDPGTRKWIPLTDWLSPEDWNLMGCDALATDAVDPSRVYVLAGTYTNDWTDQNGEVFRSTDKGNTWQRTKLPFKVGGNMPGRSMGERLTIDPNKNNILYLGARSGNGLWKSTDYGATWNKVSAFPNPGTYAQSPGAAYGGDAIGIAWITFDKSTGSLGSETKTIYVGVADKGNSIYRSTDAGVTWAAVPGQPTGYLPHHGVLSSKGMLYVAYSDSVGPYDGVKGEVWKFNTATGAWTDISPVPSSSKDDYFGYGGLTVDAQHPDTLMVATMNSYWPDANIFRSVDGGATWTRIWDWAGYPSRSLRYTQDISASPWLGMGLMDEPPVPAVKLGWMMGSLEIDPFNSDRMMYGTGATLYGAENLSAWDKGGKVDIKVMAQGIEETAILALVSPPEGAHLLSGLGDISGFRHDDLDMVPEKVMTSPTFSSTRGMDYAELKPNFIVRVGDGAHSSGFSYDGGASWFQGNSEPAGIQNGGGVVAAAADASVVVRSQNGAAVCYSKDNGNSWINSTGVPAQANVASDRVNAKKFYAYSAGAVYRSIDGGANFTKTAASGLASDAYCLLKAMPGKEGDLWLACGKAGLWRSTDSGNSIGKLAGVVNGHGIGFGKAAPGKTNLTLYASAKIGQVTGIYRSVDDGASWLRVNDDRHQYGTVSTVITGDPRIYGRVYVGARGLVYGDIASGTEPDTPPIAKDSTINLNSASFDKNASKQADVAVLIAPNGNTLNGIKNGSVALVAGTDYTVAGNTVTVLKRFLAKQATGTSVRLTFDFSAGTDPVLSIAIGDSTATASPVTLTAVGGNGKIDLTWTVSGDIKNVQVMRDTDADPAGRQRVAILSGSARSYTDTTAANGTQYWYWIKYTDTAGKTGNSNAGSAKAAATDSGNQPIPIASVAVSPASVSVAVGATAGLTGSVVPATATSKALSWRSSNTGVATVGATGVVTGVSAGNATVTATSADGNRSASSTITVTAADSGNTGNCTAVALPLVIDGAGEFCRVTTGNFSELNSWNMQLVEVNGVAFTNAYANTGSKNFPAKVDGKYTIRYVGKYAWSHLEVKGSGGSEDTGVPPQTNNSTISASATSFDKTDGKQADIAVAMTLNGNTLSAIRNGGAALIAGTDYTVSGNTVTLLKSYLAKQPTGALSLTFDFSAGKDLVLMLQIVAPVVPAPDAAPGIHVSGTQVLEANGKAFVMRGVNVAHAWYADKTSRSLSDIAKTGANTVRIVLASGDRWPKTSEADVRDLIAQAKANKLIAILEVHDTTGYGEQAGAVTLAQAVTYWKSVKNALVGQEDYVVLNIGNEPLGNGPAASAWIDGHIDAIKSLRAAGFKHAIMVDAANWGQDWQNVTRDNAASVLAADPQKNVIFSVHMYQVYAKASTIDSYMAAFKKNGLALVVGEFAADHQGQDVDEAAIMSYAKQYGDGYLGWSWSGNSSDLVALDIAKNFDAGNLSAWGNTLINGANGIKATSVLASVFAGGQGGTAMPAEPVPSAPTAPTPGVIDNGGVK